MSKCVLFEGLVPHSQFTLFFSIPHMVINFAKVFVLRVIDNRFFQHSLFFEETTSRFTDSTELFYALQSTHPSLFIVADSSMYLSCQCIYGIETHYLQQVVIILVMAVLALMRLLASVASCTSYVRECCGERGPRWEIRKTIEIRVCNRDLGQPERII